MSTGEKERKVINRAVRVLDEIESRIHELREELEANGLTSSRGRKARRDDEHDADDEGHEPQARSRRGKADQDDSGDELHGAAKAAHDAKSGGQGKADSGKADQEAKGNGHARAEHEGGDDREPHGQGRVKHPETDKRLKGNHGAGDELHGAAKDAHEAKGNGQNKADHDDEHEPHGQGRVRNPETDKRVKANKD